MKRWCILDQSTKPYIFWQNHSEDVSIYIERKKQEYQIEIFSSGNENPLKLNFQKRPSVREIFEQVRALELKIQFYDEFGTEYTVEEKDVPDIPNKCFVYIES